MANNHCTSHTPQYCVNTENVNQHQVQTIPSVPAKFMLVNLETVGNISCSGGTCTTVGADGKVTTTTGSDALN